MRFRKIHTTSRDLNLVQDAIQAAFDALSKEPLSGAQILPQVPLAAGSNTLTHGLGRNYRSWAVFRPSAAVTVYETPSPDPATFLVLVASAPATLDLLVL